MFKKLISGALSAAIILTSAASSNFFGTADVSEKTSPNIDPYNIDYDLKATNSLGKYLKSMADKNNNDLNPEKMSGKTGSTFAMNSLDFDIDTGMITAFSTQSDKCYMRFSFIDEDTNETAATYKSEVDAGECTITEKKVDTKELPQYFLLKAELVDKNDKVISETYHVDKYTKIMQEIAETNIHDFDEDRVVNFDESEDTNFIVLSDDTVIAESSDTENSLVSADFDNNTFVFEHINESIQYLRNGDFLYVQPDEENIIAVSVDNVDIDGDTATVTGSDDIDDMLAFVKFETICNMESAEIDASNSDFVFPGHEDETKFTMDEDKPVEFMYNSRKPISANLEASSSVSVSYDPNENLQLKGEAKFQVKLNFCKKWFYTSIKFVINPELSFSIKYSAEYKNSDIDAPSFIEQAGDNLKDKIIAANSDTVKHTEEFIKKLLGIDIPTPIPGIIISADIKFEIILSAEISLTCKYSPEFGICGNSDSGYEEIVEAGSDKFELTERSIKGSISFNFIVTPQLKLIDERILSCGIEFKGGITIEVKPFVGPAISRFAETSPTTQYHLSDDAKVAYLLDVDEDYMHSCDICFDADLFLNFSIAFKTKVLKKSVLDFTIAELKIHIMEFYFGYPNFDPGIEISNVDSYEHGFLSFIADYLGKPDFGFRKVYNPGSDEKTCPHFKYKTTFHVTDENGSPINGAIVTINGLEKSTNNYGNAQFYCDDGSYRYSVRYFDKDCIRGSIKINRSVNTENIVLHIEANEDGSINKISGESYSNVDVEYTTAATTKTTAPVSTTTTAFVENKDDEMLEAKRLGDNVWGIIYPDGFMLIFGHGDMYSDLPTSVFKNIGIVKQVVFEDDDPENGQYITSIGNNLFLNAKNLEYVYLSNEITNIGDKAFKGCEKLKCFRYGGEKDKTETFVFPTKLKYIGNSAFYGCETAAFGDFVFNKNVREIGASAFYGCTNITSVMIPETVTKIEPTVFYKCSNIITAVIKTDIDEMGAGLFYGCNQMQELTIPGFPTYYHSAENDTSVSMLFHNCSNNSGTYIPPTLKKINVIEGSEIPEKAFSAFNNVETIALPEGITKIGNHAFYSMKTLKNLICYDETKDLSFSELFKDVEEIGEQAFSYDPNLIIGDLVFGNNTKTIGASAFLMCPNVTSVVIPESVESIGPTAFYGCSNIITAVIKNDIDEMGAGLFYDCNQMQELTIQGFPTYYYSTRNDTSLSMLFYNCSNNSRTYVPPTLTKVNIMGGSEMPENYLDAFRNVKTLSLPNELKLVGQHATQNMKSLEEVIYNGTEEEWNEIVIREENDPLLGAKLTFAPDEAAEWLPGDANGDGELDMSDVVLIMQALANPDRYGIDGSAPVHMTLNSWKYADVDGNGLTVNDALRIQQYLLGEIPSLV